MPSQRTRHVDTGIEVVGGPERIRVLRESPGQNMWLYDMWLIERLLEASSHHRT
jgi:hypothetical protein